MHWLQGNICSKHILLLQELKYQEGASRFAKGSTYFLIFKTTALYFICNFNVNRSNKSKESIETVVSVNYEYYVSMLTVNRRSWSV